MTFDEYWKLNSKRLHSENPWREELAREVWEACVAQFTKELYDRLEQWDEPIKKESEYWAKSQRREFGDRND